MITLLAMIFTLGLVVFIHELGHFLAARAVGIHVHRFSIGLGPVLLRWRGFGTEWALSLLPFGGYVKMAGMVEAVGEGEVPEEEATLPPDLLYRNKSVPKRLLAIVAGPLANLILAVALTTGVLFVQGLPIYPDVWLSTPEPGSAAAMAGIQHGDKVLSLDGEEVPDWNFFAGRLSDGGARDYGLVVNRAGERVDLILTLTATDGKFDPPGLRSLHDNRVGRVLKDGPAYRLGLRHGDRIVAVDGEPVAFFDEIAERVNASPGVELSLAWLRDGERMEGLVTPEEAQAPDPADDTKVVDIGRIFFEPYNEGYRKIGLGEATKYGFLQISYTARLTLQWLGKQVTGQGSWDSVGGPVKIAEVAGQMARWGWDRLLGFIAFFSTQLFLLNLLPIPVLDGGHVVFLAMEGLGRPMREDIRMRMTMAGMVLLLGFMLFVLTRELWQLVV